MLFPRVSAAPRCFIPCTTGHQPGNSGSSAVIVTLAAFVLLFLALQGVLLWLAAADRTLSHAERFSSALTFNILGWTAIGLLTGFVGLFRTGWILAAATLLAAGLAGLGCAIRVPLPRRKDMRAILAPLFEFMAELRAPGWTLAAMGALAAGAFLLLGIRLPVLDYDGLSYHLGLALHIAQDGDFRYYPGESGYTNHFARGVELLMAKTILATGGFHLVNAVQWVLLPVLVPAGYAAGRALGLDRTHAAVGAFLPLTVPVILYQTSIAYVDLFSTGFFAAGLFAVLGARGRGVGPGRVLWMFACAGLAMAAKFNAAVLAPLLGVVALLAWGWRPLFGTRRALAVTAMGFMLAACVGTPWLVRNWMGWGSPLYPFGVEVAGVTLAEGVFPLDAARRMAEAGDLYDMPLREKTWLSWSRIDIESWSRLGFLGWELRSVPLSELQDHTFGHRGDEQMGGFGLAWLLFLFPSMLALAVWAVVEGVRGGAKLELGNPRGGPRWELLAAAAPVAAYLLIVAPWWTRFSIFMPLLGAVCFAAVAERLRRRWRLAGSLFLWAGIAAAAFDWSTALFLNRQWEVMRRYQEDTGEVSQTPVKFFAWASPDNPDYSAVARFMEAARPGETISYYTPGNPIFTGFFAEETATVRLFPFPTVWPPDHLERYPPGRLIEFVREEEIALMLVYTETPEHFVELLRDEGAELLFDTWHYQAYVLPQHRRKAPHP